MKLVLEPEKLNKFLKAVLVDKKLDNITGNFSDAGVQFKNINLEVIAIAASYPKNYFQEFQTGNESIVLTSSLLNRLNWGFKDKKVELSTGKGKGGEDSLILKGGTENYDEPIIDSDETTKFPLTLTVSKDYGIVPETYNPQSLYLVNIAEMNLPNAEVYEFEITPKGLFVNIKDVGNYTKKINVAKAIKSSPMKVLFDGEYFQSILKNMEGEFFLGFNQEALVASKNSEQYLLTYLLSSLEE